MGFLNKFKKNNHKTTIKPTNIDEPILDNSNDDKEKKLEHRRIFEQRLSVIVSKMRQAKISEEEILKYIDEQRTLYIEERELPEDELRDKRKKQFENSMAKSERKELKKILEIYFEEDIDESAKYQSEDELEKTKEAYNLLIDKMIRMSEEELEEQYIKIDAARRIKCEKDNRNKVFKECLEKEVVLNIKDGTLKQSEVADFRKKRINSYMNGIFDYPEDIREEMIKSIRRNNYTHLIDPNNLPKTKERIEWIKAKLTLEK